MEAHRGNEGLLPARLSAPHTDSVASCIDFSVPIDQFGPLAEFDGSVICERTAGEVSARCHDEQANCLALNLMHDIVTGAKSVAEARYYGQEFLDYRRKKPTPYSKACASPRARATPVIPTPARSRRATSSAQSNRASVAGDAEHCF
jgi:hypothetical protein